MNEAVKQAEIPFFFLADPIFKERNVAWNKDSTFLELSLSRQPSIQINYADFFKQ